MGGENDEHKRGQDYGSSAGNTRLAVTAYKVDRFLRIAGGKENRASNARYSLSVQEARSDQFGSLTY